MTDLLFITAALVFQRKMQCTVYTCLFKCICSYSYSCECSRNRILYFGEFLCALLFFRYDLNILYCLQSPSIQDSHVVQNNNASFLSPPAPISPNTEGALNITTALEILTYNAHNNNMRWDLLHNCFAAVGAIIPESLEPKLKKLRN